MYSYGSAVCPKLGDVHGRVRNLQFEIWLFPVASAGHLQHGITEVLQRIGGEQIQTKWPASKFGRTALPTFSSLDLAVP